MNVDAAAPADRTSPAVDLSRLTFEVHASPEPLRVEWQGFEAKAVTTLFQSYTWISAWCRTAAADLGEEPLILVARDGAGGIAFIWPMAVTRWCGACVLTWLGQAHSGYFLGLYRADVMAGMDRQTLLKAFAEIVRQRPAVSALHLTSQPATWDGAANPMALLGADDYPVPAFQFPLGPDYETLCKKRFSGKTRNTIRRRERQLRELGADETAPVASAEQRLALYDVFARQKAIHLDQQGKPNAFARTPIDRFYRELAAGFAGSVPLEIAGMTLEGETVATVFGMTFRSRYYFLQTSMALGGPAQLSPGMVLLHQVVRRRCQDGTRVFDLGPGAGVHKDAWHPDTIALISTFVPLRAAGRPATLLRQAVSGMKRAIKRHPALYRAADRVRRLFSLGQRRARMGVE